MVVGDKIVCINTGGPSCNYLTLNKVYIVVGMEIDNPAVINDNNERIYYQSSRFISIQQRRDLLISELVKDNL